MKNSYLLVLLLLSLTNFTSAQIPSETEPEKLTHWLTPGELLRLNEIGRGFVETPPPVSPVRNVAEFDRVQGALIRYPFGVPVTVAKEIAENITLTTIVANAYTENNGASAICDCRSRYKPL